METIILRIQAIYVISSYFICHDDNNNLEIRITMIMVSWLDFNEQTTTRNSQNPDK